MAAEHLDERERRYCLDHMLAELRGKSFGRDTRVFLSLDVNDKALIEDLLMAALTDMPGRPDG
jgi:hypothetical protein